MKKSLLIILFNCLAMPSSILAQSFSIPQSSYSYWGDLTNGLASVSVPVTNTTSTDIDVIVERIQNNLSQHHSSLFCFGIQCYDTSALSSAVINFAGHSTEVLLADLNKNGALGTSCVTYRIKDVNNVADYSDVEVCFNITTTGISTVQSAAISSPQPNPADRFAAVSYNLTGDYKDYKVYIYNILGNPVKELRFSEKSGILLLPTSELTSGVYFYSLASGNKIVSTNKLIVAHK